MKDLNNVTYLRDDLYRRVVHLPADWSNLFNDETS